MKSTSKKQLAPRKAGISQKTTKAQGTKKLRVAAKPEFAIFEVRPRADDPESDKNTKAPLVHVKVSWPAGQGEHPNFAAKAVLDAIGPLVIELAQRRG